MYSHEPDSDPSDVIVVGGGVAGLASALALLRAGRTVRLIEARTLGSGASHGNCGTLTPSHAPPLAAPGTVLKALKWMLTPDAPLYVHPGFDPALWRWLTRFALRCNHRDWERSARAKHAILEHSLQRIRGWVDELALDCGFRESGEDYVFRTEKLFEHDQLEFPLLRELGVQVEAIGGRTYESMEPALKPGIAGAIRFRGDAMLRPDRYVDELARNVRALGGTIRESCALSGLQQSGLGWEIEAGGMRFNARNVVVATGSWSPLLARMLGAGWLRGLIQPGKGYSITYSPPKLAPRRPMILRERSVCVTTWGDGYRLGSTMEFSGYDDSLNPRRLAALERGAREYLHDPVGPDVQERWCGWRPMCVDDVPLIGAVPGRPGLWLATGHGMMGVGMSAGTGELIADLVCGRETHLDPADYAPARFA